MTRYYHFRYYDKMKFDIPCAHDLPKCPWCNRDWDKPYTTAATSKRRRHNRMPNNGRRRSKARLLPDSQLKQGKEPGVWPNYCTLTLLVCAHPFHDEPQPSVVVEPLPLQRTHHPELTKAKSLTTKRLQGKTRR